MSDRDRLRTVARILAAGLLLAASIAGSGGATIAQAPAASDAEKVLSHVLCRQGRFRPAFNSLPTVQLTDQFGSATVQVRQPNLMCNPVRKVRAGKVTKVVDAKHHLKWYPLQASLTSQVKDMLITNQFGANQAIQMNMTPVVMLVPTRVPPQGRPRGLDHFKCYNVHSAPTLNANVRLRDEVDSLRTKVVIQWVFCDPTDKVHGSTHTSIKHPDVHLACYVLQVRDADKPLLQHTITQFEPKSRNATVRVNTANTLCVPSSSQAAP
jgi:hypothetical protein